MCRAKPRREHEAVSECRFRAPFQSAVSLRPCDSVHLLAFSYSRVSHNPLGAALPPSTLPRVTLEAQLYQLMLYYLLWGEAANLRHTPECLCFLFYCASNALLVHYDPYRGTAPVKIVRRESGQLEKASQGGSQLLRIEPVPQAGDLPGFPLPAGYFLHSMVTPIYKYMASEILGKAKQPIAERVLYDDINEAFWDGAALRGWLQGGAHQKPGTLSSTAYLNVRDLLTSLGKNDGGGLSNLFHKTYIERVGWSHSFYSYYRVFLVQACLLHVQMVIAFADGRPSWRDISTVVGTHEVCVVAHHALGIAYKPPKSMRGIVRKHFQILGHLGILVYLLAEVACDWTLPWSVIEPSSSFAASWESVFGSSPSAFEVIAMPYLLLMLERNLRLARWSKHQSGVLGSVGDVIPAVTTRCIYLGFWTLVLTLKVRCIGTWNRRCNCRPKGTSNGRSNGR